MKTIYLIIILAMLTVASCSQKNYNLQPENKVQTENKAQPTTIQKISIESKASQDAFSDFESTKDLDSAIEELGLIE